MSLPTRSVLVVVKRSALLLLTVFLATGCPSPADGPAAPDAAAPFQPSASVAEVDAGAAHRPTPLLLDQDVGPLIERLSETPGDFPSDNYVSNETSYLDVADAMRNPTLRGRAYVGVGPEQNFTYVAMMEPEVAYVVDIRRGNLLEHMVLRGCFEEGATRAAFLTALLARHPAKGGGDLDADFGALAASFASSSPDRTLRDAGVARTLALLDRLHVARAPGDESAVARIHDAFFARGLSLAYSMKNSGRRYPSLGETLAERDSGGSAASFLASDDLYSRVRERILGNRVIPIVGDFGGRRALRAVADDIKARGLLLGAFYTSNVEQYLFDEGTYSQFVANVRAMPRDGASILVRVWFDQGRPHPLQHRGQRTTSLVTGADSFVERAAQRPFRSYWEVVTASP